jgi:hypothetical protein
MKLADPVWLRSTVSRRTPGGITRGNLQCVPSFRRTRRTSSLSRVPGILSLGVATARTIFDVMLIENSA